MPNYQNLFVAKLPRTVADTDLLAVFGPYGPTSATVMLDAVTGRSKGFGFVLFSTDEAGRAAEAALNQTIVTATASAPPASWRLAIFPSKHAGTAAAEESSCLFIRNLPNSWSLDAVEVFLAQIAVPTYSAVRRDHHGSPVWVVFVEYATVADARTTLRKVHGMPMKEEGAPAVLAKFAESEEVKQLRRDRRPARFGGAPTAPAPKGRTEGNAAAANNAAATSAVSDRAAAAASARLHVPSYPGTFSAIPLPLTVATSAHVPPPHSVSTLTPTASRMKGFSSQSSLSLCSVHGASDDSDDTDGSSGGTSISRVLPNTDKFITANSPPTTTTVSPTIVCPPISPIAIAISPISPPTICPPPTASPPTPTIVSQPPLRYRHNPYAVASPKEATRCFY